MPCTHQFLVTLTVHTTKSNSHPDADTTSVNPLTIHHPVVVIPVDGQHMCPIRVVASLGSTRPARTAADRAALARGRGKSVPIAIATATSCSTAPLSWVTSGRDNAPGQPGREAGIRGSTVPMWEVISCPDPVCAGDGGKLCRR